MARVITSLPAHKPAMAGHWHVWLVSSSVPSSLVCTPVLKSGAHSRAALYACHGFQHVFPLGPSWRGRGWGRALARGVGRCRPCAAEARQRRLPPPCVLPQLVYMGFDAAAADAALRVFRGNVQLAAQTLAHNGGSLPPDVHLSLEGCSSTPSTSPSDSAVLCVVSNAYLSEAC